MFNWIREKIDLMRLDTWVLEGREKHGGAPLAFAYAGAEAHKNHFALLAYGDAPFKEHALGKRWLWAIKRAGRAVSADCNLNVVEIDESRDGMKVSKLLKSSIVNPGWQAVEMDLKDLPTIDRRKYKYRRMRNKIVQNGLGYEIRTDEASFRRFYHDMYVPYTRGRFGATANVDPYEELKRRLPFAELLFVKKDGMDIAGSFIDYRKDKPRLLAFGVLGAAEEYLDMGAMYACYVYSFERIFERGGKSVHMGYCRGFLKDGVLRLKTSIGGELTASHLVKRGCLRMRFLKFDPGLKSFLIHNPFVSIDEGSRYAASFFANSLDDFGEKERDLISTLCTDRLPPRLMVFEGAPAPGKVSAPPVESAESLLVP